MLGCSPRLVGGALWSQMCRWEAVLVESTQGALHRPKPLTLCQLPAHTTKSQLHPRGPPWFSDPGVLGRSSIHLAGSAFLLHSGTRDISFSCPSVATDRDALVRFLHVPYAFEPGEVPLQLQLPQGLTRRHVTHTRSKPSQTHPSGQQNTAWGQSAG